ncbi:alpha-ribazole phosphatase [Flavobacteriaceae bacterium R38]|nr:alpha-ribazole phosphatase [Flavobacteriaceae bacterium R38]
MEIYLIRHTTPKIDKGICYGQADLELIPNFKKEINEVLSKIDAFKNGIVYSSPSKRCSLLAKNISETVRYDDRIKELDFGDWELKSWDEIHQTDLNKWMSDFVNEQVPNGESYIWLFNRSLSFFNEVIQTKNEQVFIITHAGVMRSILSDILKMDLKDSFDIKINYGDVIHLKYVNEKVSIQSGLLINNKFM